MTPNLSKPVEDRVAPPVAADPAARRFDWAALSDQGRHRGNNEDAWGAFSLDGQLTPLAPSLSAWPPQGALFVLSDGMGGASAGEEASKFCVARVAVELHARLALPDKGAAMREAFVATHAALTAMSRTNHDWLGMGATLSALWLQSAGGVVLGHIGDSRVYGVRCGGCRQWTEDHTLGEGLVRRGVMVAEAAARFRFRSLLEQVMGGDGRSIEPQIVNTTWQPGDGFALCSDGLYRPLASGLDTRLNATLQQGQLSDGARLLVDAANAAGGPDNITVVLVRAAFPGKE